MKLQTLFIIFFQVQGVKTATVLKSFREVSGYLGENITLPSGADPSWNLFRIEWSIFTNTTWIATYHNGVKNIRHIPQYAGRLTLSETSGDLTIRHLKENDAMEYTVNLLNRKGDDEVNKIKLTVKQKLQQPSIQIVTSTSVESGCLMVVTCSSLDEGVNLSWSVEPVSVLTINKNHPSNSSAQLFAFVSTKENSTFTCISSRDTESVSSKPVTPKCESKICVSNCTTPCSPTTVTQWWPFILFIALVVIGCLFYRYAVKSQNLRDDLSVMIQTCVAWLQRRRKEYIVSAQRRKNEEEKTGQVQEEQVTALRPSEEEKRNQNEDSNERASKEKETIQHKEENRELVQEQEEQENLGTAVYANDCTLKPRECHISLTENA